MYEIASVCQSNNLVQAGHTCASPMSVPASSTVCDRALGGTASVPSQGAMPRMPTTASTASCTTNHPEGFNAAYTMDCKQS